MSSLPEWVQHALHMEAGRRKVLLNDREVARSGRALADLLRHFGLDPEQPYSQMHLPDLGSHVYCQPPFDFPCAAEGA